MTWLLKNNPVRARVMLAAAVGFAFAAGWVFFLADRLGPLLYAIFEPETGAGQWKIVLAVTAVSALGTAALHWIDRSPSGRRFWPGYPRLEPDHLLQEIIDSLDEIVFAKDRELRYILVNRAYCELLGRDRSDFIGKTSRDLFPPELAEEFETSDLEVLETGQSRTYELGPEFRGPDSTVLTTKSPLRDGSGRIIGIVATLVDISGRKRIENALERELRLTRGIVATVREPLIVLDNEFNILSVSESFIETFAVSRRDTIHQNLYEIAAGTWDAPALRKILDQVRERGDPVEGYEFEHVFPKVGRKLLVVNARKVKTEDVAGEAYLLAFEDVTEERRAAKIVRDSEKRLARAFDSMMDGVATITASGEIEFVNEACLEIFGYTADQLIGRNVKMLMDEPEASRHDGFLGRYLETGEARIIGIGREVHGRRSDGSTFPLELSVSEFEVDGQRRFTGVLRDISERKRAEEALHRQGIIIDQSPDALMTLDLDGNFTSWNQGAQRLFGYSIDEALGQHFSFLDEYPDDSDGIALWEELKSVERTGFEGRRRRKSGEVFDCEVAKAILRDRDGEAVGAVVACRDITERKRTEEELRIANQAKSDFLSSMSHELRTPLNAVLGYGQLLQLDDDNALNDKQKEAVANILTGGQQLLRLIDMVLELSKIEAGHLLLEMTDVHPGPATQECVTMVQGLADSAGVTITNNFLGGGAPAVRADPFRLKQILLNFLSNSVKYNRQGGSVTLDWELTAGETLRILVTDTGRGIPEALQHRIFEPFNRLGVEDSRIEGTGIGLTITKQLVEMMDGTVGLDSTAGGGSTFWFELPLAGTGDSRPTPRAVEEEIQISGNGDWEHLSGTVLCVEDHAASRELMETLFERFPNVNLLTAADPAAALALAESNRFDLILLDINLPGMSGYELLERLRGAKATASTPIVAVTANAMPEEIEKARAASFDQYLTKPFRLPELISIVEAYLTNPGE